MNNNNIYNHTTYKTNRPEVLRRDGYQCAYCGREADTVDHVTPIEVALQLGWAIEQINSMNNLIACCKTCNSSKQDRIDIRTNRYNTAWLSSM